jgi:hypothetical protein
MTAADGAGVSWGLLRRLYPARSALIRVPRGASSRTAIFRAWSSSLAPFDLPEHAMGEPRTTARRSQGRASGTGPETMGSLRLDLVRFGLLGYQ